MYTETRINNKRSAKKGLRRSLKKRKALILCLVITLFVCYASFDVSAKANRDNKAPMTKVFVTYEVKSGDNLWSIAKECCNREYYSSYEKYIDEIISINHIKGEKIYAGNKITIPEYI